MNLGLPELLLIFVVALVVFGPKRLPEIGQQLGKAMRDFKKAMNPDETEAAGTRPAPKSADPAPIEATPVLAAPPTMIVARGQKEETEGNAFSSNPPTPPPSAEGRV